MSNINDKDGVFESRDDGSFRFLPAVTLTPQEHLIEGHSLGRRVRHARFMVLRSPIDARRSLSEAGRGKRRAFRDRSATIFERRSMGAPPVAEGLVRG